MEMLISIFIFSLIAGTMISLLVASISNQRNSLARQDLVNQVSFTAEYMSRALRQAQKDLTAGGDCIPFGTNYQQPGGGSMVRFLAHDGNCREFVFLGNTIQESRSTDEQWTNFDPPIELLSDNLEVLTLRFILLGEDQPPANDEQPRITFFMEVRSVVERAGREPKISLQTTISQRRYDREE